jgi:inorganic pyrophosphatase
MLKTNVVIETPRGSNAKYAYDPARRAFVLRRVFPLGMAMPWDFGFIPGTIAEDGDPLDVIAVSEVSCFPGCEVECRIVGAITAEQREDDGAKPVRNDRVVVVPCETRAFAHVKELEELGGKLLNDVDAFFVHYHQMLGNAFKPLGRLSAKDAAKLIEKYRHD